MKNKHSRLFPSSIAASFILLAPSAFADAITWDAGGADKNWSTVANWSDDAAPTGDDVTFNATGALATGSTNIVSASESIASLSYNFEDAINQHTTDIAAAQTLTVAGNFSVLAPITNPTAPTNVSIKGSTGTLDVTGTSFLLGNPSSTATVNTTTSLDMSGLGTLTANLTGGASVLRVGGGGAAGTTFANPVTLKLPVNSTITANTVGVSDASNFNTVQKMLLGSGATTINTDNLRVGNNFNGRSSGEISFNAAPGTLLLRGLAGGVTPVTTLNMVNSNSGSSNNLAGTVNLAGHHVDAKITTLNMALRSGSGNTTGFLAQAALTFNQGSLEVGTANVARNANAALDGKIDATINIGGGIANFGTINMADNASGNTSKVISATLNLTGGTTTVTGDIVKLGTTNAVASVNLNGGTLDMDAGNVGSLANPVTLSLLSGVLKNVGEISGGDIVAGLISKTTAGSVILSGTINYTGGSSVTGGALVFRDTTAKPATGTHAFSANTTLGLGVGASAPLFTSTDVDNAFSGTMTGNLSNVTATATTNVGIDTTAGDFTYAVLGSPTKGLTKFGINTLTLTGANNYTGPTVINQGTLAFASTPSLTGSLTFGTSAANTDAGTLDLTTANATFSGVMLVNTNSATASEIKIGPAQTLTINNNVQIGAITPAVTGTVTKLNLTGGGTLNVATAAAGTFTVGGGALGANSQVTTLDLTAIKATTINTSTTGTLRVNPVSGSQTSSRAVLLLPTPPVVDTIATSTVTAGTIAVGDAGTNTNVGTGNPIVMGSITLGTGLTALNVNTINVGTGGRDVGQIIYNQAVGDLMIRAAGGTGRATAINIATGGASGSNTGNSRIDLSGHDADILVTSLNVGNQAKSGTVAIGTNEFNFGEQTTGVGVGSLASQLDATNVNIGFRTGTASVTSTMTSKVNLSGGTVTFGNVGATGTGVDIGNSTYSGAGVAKTIGELNISGGNVTIHNGTGNFAVRLGSNVNIGGTVTASMNVSGGITTLGGDIIRNATSPGTTSTVKVSGGTLNLDGKKIGTSSTEPITLTAESGTLQNVASINVTGGLTKTTAGSLILSGTNTYAGDTIVSGGTLALGANNALPATPVAIGSATLDAATFDATMGTLDVTGSAVINLGAGANLVFANSSGIDWTGGTLNLTGTFVSGSSLNFGPGGLLPAQLSLISASGFTGFALDVNGFLTATAGGSNFASWANDPTKGNIPGQPPTGDFDNDGITNIVEYALGKNPRVSSQPAGVLAGNVITYTKGADAIANGDVSWVIETSQTLALGSWTPQVTQPAGNPAATISYTLTPGTPVKNFARLKVTQQ